MIVATAGHVDHGKTLLIKALTGVDTDRLPDEKKRGLTIDIGFAYLPLPGLDEPIGFIDVPGHERFIRNMVCGVAGIDYALFVIAADDGPMPQSLEHLAILDLLGVDKGAVALTKTDRVDGERLKEVGEEIEILLAGTTLEGAEIMPVSALTGEGIADLRDRLLEAAKDHRARLPAGRFRLAVDRCFDITGAGLIVTGTVFAGTCRVGDQVRILGRDGTFRVRSIRAQDQTSEMACAGQRAALNLAGSGLSRSIVGRGDWIVSGRTAEPVAKVDVRIKVLTNEPRALAHWTPVHVHHGAAETTGRVALLDTKAVEPGGSALAQLVLDEAIGAVNGDGIIVRDQSARRTIGGGRVIDIFTPRRGRASDKRLAELRALETGDHQNALAALLDVTSGGVDLDRFALSRNLDEGDAERMAKDANAFVLGDGNQRFAFSGQSWEALQQAVIETLQKWHAEHPEQIGLGDEPLLRSAGIRLNGPIARPVAEAIAQAGTIVREALGLRLPSHQPGLAGGDRALWQKVAETMESDGLRPGSLADLSERLGLPQRRLQSFLTTAGRSGLVHRISNTRYLTKTMLDELSEIAKRTAEESEDGRFDARAFRDASGIGRNMAIEVLEYLDKIGFTRRVGETREIRR